MSGKYFLKTGRVFPGDLILTEERRKWDTRNGWNNTFVYKGERTTIEWYMTNRATAIPTAKNVEAVKSGIFWELHVNYGVYLHSTWTLDSAMHEVPLVASDMGIQLDQGFPGWARFIENTIDNHYAAETAKNRFDYNTIKSAALFENDGTTRASISHNDFNAIQLDIVAVNYAKAYLTGTESFFQPRWIIRNEVTISPDYNLDVTGLLYSDVNSMLARHWMVKEGLLGETIPVGIIVPAVNWWYKQPFKKQQTSENLFIISREWWGLDWFNENLYSAK